VTCLYGVIGIRRYLLKHSTIQTRGAMQPEVQGAYFAYARWGGWYGWDREKIQMP